MLRTPVFAGDWLMGGLKPAHPALARLDRSEYLAAWFGLLRTLVVRQLMLGQDALVDDVVSSEQALEWRETADRFSARLFFIECICSDRISTAPGSRGGFAVSPAGTRSGGTTSSGCARKGLR